MQHPRHFATQGNENAARKWRSCAQRGVRLALRLLRLSAMISQYFTRSEVITRLGPFSSSQ
jgi:hypothetical protein